MWWRIFPFASDITFDTEKKGHEKNNISHRVLRGLREEIFALWGLYGLCERKLARSSS
jgi:hypothetical protein